MFRVVSAPEGAGTWENSMAALILGSAERQLIELLRGSEPDKLHLTIHRSSLDGWEIEMSFEARDKDDRTLQRTDRGAGPTFAEAWEELVSVE
jgi:hypothetical protein